MIMCVSFLPQTTVLNKVSCTRLSVKIALISYWNDFSLIPLELGNLEVCFLEERDKIMQKIQILKILRVSSIRYQEVCL